MKKIYQMPEIMMAEMMSLSMVAQTTPQVGIDKSARIYTEEVEVKGAAWDDFDE